MPAGGFATLLGGNPSQPAGGSARARPVDFRAMQQTGRGQIAALMTQAEALVPRAQAQDPEAMAQLNMLMNRIDQIEEQEHQAFTRSGQRGVQLGMGGAAEEELKRKQALRRPPGAAPGSELP